MKSSMTEQRILAGIEPRPRLDRRVESFNESTEAKVPRALRMALLAHVEETLNTQGKKYGAKFSITLAAKGIEVRSWIGAPVNETGEEAREIATMFLGSGFAFEQHKLKKGLWVATATYQLADILA